MQMMIIAIILAAEADNYLPSASSQYQLMKFSTGLVFTERLLLSGDVGKTHSS